MKINTQSVSFINTIKVFFRDHIPIRRKRHLVFLLILSFVTSVVEILSIASVLPFISALTEPNVTFNHELLHPIFEKYGFNSPSEIILPLTIIFVVSILISTLLRLFLLTITTKVAFGTGIDVSLDLYKKILQQPYLFHTMKNSSEIINVVSVKVSEVIFYIVMPTIGFITSAIMSLVMAGLLLYFLPVSLIWIMMVFVGLYLVILKLIKKRLKENSEIIANESTQIVKTVQEGLGGIRDILIDKTQENFTIGYERATINVRKAQAQNSIFGNAPKFFLEAVGLIFVAYFAFSITGDNTVGGSNSSIVPLLAGIVLTIQKLLPLMQAMFNSLSLMQAAQAALKDVIEYLDLNCQNDLVLSGGDKKMNFTTNICIDNLGFRYSSDGVEVLNSIDLTIEKGSIVGFIGATGSGKSTLLDILMGLLEPTQGKIYIDDQALNLSNIHLWQSLIAHVPQSIYLTDNSITENIAFGVGRDEIDFDLVLDVAKKAQISDVIQKMPKGYATIIGERGVQLSGGQRQRLGIARALYKKAPVIILDEATSALDTGTEAAVMDVFDSLGDSVTVLMIAHRISTLKNCTVIVDLEKGRVARTVTYDDLRESNETN
jgi:ABC-type multidrug transport system fused ATPase/permease subunit